jgi:hypothetical protein
MRVALLRRSVEAEGGFAAVVHKGDAERGDIMLLVRERGGNTTVMARRMRDDGEYGWAEIVLPEGGEEAVDEAIKRARARDPDLWVLDLDVADPARFVERVHAIN